jgi:pyruvate dehydrogenase E1 component alpha subunit
MTKDDLIQFEETLVEDWKEGLIKVPCHLSGGNEDALIELFKEIKPTDWVVSTHRNHYHYLLKGGDAHELRKEILGLPNRLSDGRSGSMHTTDLSCRFVSSCLVGCGAPVAVGIALSIALRSGGEKVWCFLGDGAVDEGMFYESLCYAEGRKLPVTFVVEDNNRSVVSSQEERCVRGSDTRYHALCSRFVRYIEFTPTYPHVADGSFISF